MCDQEATKSVELTNNNGVYKLKLHFRMTSANFTFFIAFFLLITVSIINLFEHHTSCMAPDLKFESNFLTFFTVELTGLHST